LEEGAASLAALHATNEDCLIPRPVGHFQFAVATPRLRAYGWHRPGGIDDAQSLSMNRLSVPLPSQTMSARWFLCRSLSATVLWLSSAPPVRAAEIRTIPPDANVPPLELALTWLSVMRVRTTPTSTMPPPLRGGAPSAAGQNLLLPCTLFSSILTSPAPPGWPSSSTSNPTGSYRTTRCLSPGCCARAG